MYLVMVVNKKQKISVAGCMPQLESEMNICWADGMIGAVPVFEVYEDAEKYANDKQIIEVNELIDSDSNEGISKALAKEISDSKRWGHTEK